MRHPSDLRILHISDLHCGKEDGKRGSQWRMRRVLGAAWEKNLHEIADGRVPDIVCFTGDLAQAGKAEQYAAVSEFLDDLLACLGLDKERLFVVPGNHDVDRSVNRAAWAKVRHAPSRDLSGWMAGTPTWGFEDEWRDETLARQQAYRDWVAAYWPDRRFPATHPHLGYRISLAEFATPVHLIGLDSAWLAGDNDDMGKLGLTDEQIARNLTGPDGLKLDGVKIVLQHHPLGELFDGKQARSLMAEYGVNLLMHGHVHDPNHQRWQHPNHGGANLMQESVAGCLYENDIWPNCMQVIDLQLNGGDGKGGRDVRAVGTVGAVRQIWLRSWSKNGFWHNDDSHYAGSQNGRLVITPTRPPAPAPASTRASALAHSPVPAGERELIGREGEMAQLCKVLLVPPEQARPVALCCTVEGMPGVGKTHLAEAFIRRHWAAGRPFHSSFVRLFLQADIEPDALSMAQQLAAHCQFSSHPEQVFTALREHLITARCLLLIENVDSETHALAVGVLVSQIPGCPVLVTARYLGIGKAGNWRRVSVDELPPADALKLLRVEAPACRASNAELKDLAQQLGHLPLALHIAASHLEDGYSVRWFLEQLHHDMGLLPADPADPLRHSPNPTQRAKAILHGSFQLSWANWCKRYASQAAMCDGLALLAHGPANGCGPMLGAALAGLMQPEHIAEECVTAYETLCMAAKKWSLARFEDGWISFHPLLKEWLAQQTTALQALAEERWQAWLLARLPIEANEGSGQQGRAWKQLQHESEALAEWLAHCPLPQAIALQAVSAYYASYQGPFTLWQRFATRALAQVPADDAARSRLYWLLGQTAFNAGDLDVAWQAAVDRHDLALAENNEREAALSSGLQADILERRGELDEALRILFEEEIPVYEKLEEVRQKAVALGQVADILTKQDKLDEAMRIRREEEIPAYEQLGAVRDRAVALGKVADILAKRGELDESLRIRREEELPVYEQFGNARERAIALGKIANILAQRRELDEAIRIYGEDVIPVIEKLGDAYALMLGRWWLADYLQQRAAPGDLAEARQLFNLALSTAEKLRNPKTIADLQAWLDTLPPAPQPPP
jgi:predicted MPP superfamily phosphohydrolase/tetratricopeptide (TPR) repeat protein